MLTRRDLLATAAGTLVAATALPATAQDKPYEGVQLSVLMEGHPITDAIQKMLPDFTRLTGIEVVPEQDITAKELLEFSSDSGRYDVVQNNIIYIPGFLSAGYIVPLDEFLAATPEYFKRADFVPGYFDTNVVDGKTYGLSTETLNCYGYIAAFTNFDISYALTVAMILTIFTNLALLAMYAVLSRGGGR